MTKRSKTSPPSIESATPSASQSPDAPPIKRHRGKGKARRKDAFTATDRQRAQVEVLAAAGVGHEIIAEMIGCPSKRTLYRYFEKELKLGGPKLVSMAVNVISRALTHDNVPWPDKLRAAIYVTKARGDWRERDVLEHTGKNGGPIEHVAVGKLTDKELADLERILAKIGPDRPAPDAGADPGRAPETRH